MWQKIKKWLVVSIIILAVVGSLAFIFAVPGVYEWIERTLKRYFGQGISGSGQGNSDKISRDEADVAKNGKLVDESIGKIGNQVDEIKRTSDEIGGGSQDLRKLADGLREIASEPDK